MARLVIILGKSGSGKSSSLRNFKKGEAQVVSCAGKEFPFKSELSPLTPKSYTEVYTAIESSKAPVVVLDDLNFMMVQSEFRRLKEEGFFKFADYALELEQVFDHIKSKNSDQTFYVMAHPEEATDYDSQLEFKISVGKLSRKFPITAKTNVVLEAAMDEAGEFVFKVQTDGRGVKTPIGMFDKPTVPNDLKVVDAIIRSYYAPSVSKETP